jgi:hypothetical protein
VCTINESGLTFSLNNNSHIAIEVSYAEGAIELLDIKRGRESQIMRHEEKNIEKFMAIINTIDDSF